MKKRSYLSLLFFCLLASTLLAQLQKGDRLFINTDGLSTLPLISNQPTASNQGLLLVDDLADGSLLATTLKYGFVINERWVAGAGLVIFNLLQEGAGGSFAVAPFGRYYFKNQPDIMLFGGLQTTIIAQDGVTLGNARNFIFAPSAGLSVPITRNLLFSPELTYAIGNGPNPFGLNLQLEFVLGENNRESGQSVSSFSKGSLLFGAQAGSVLFRGDGQGTVVNFAPSLHYFLGNRLAIGLGAAVNNISADGTSLTSTLIDANLRYYLSQYKHITPFLQAGIFIDGNSVSTNGQAGNISSSQTGLELAAGLDIWLRENLALEVGLGIRDFPDSDGTLLAVSVGGIFSIGGN